MDLSNLTSEQPPMVLDSAPIEAFCLLLVEHQYEHHIRLIIILCCMLYISPSIYYSAIWSDQYLSLLVLCFS